MRWAATELKKRSRSIASADSFTHAWRYWFGDGGADGAEGGVVGERLVEAGGPTRDTSDRVVWETQPTSILIGVSGEYA